MVMAGTPRQHERRAQLLIVVNNLRRLALVAPAPLRLHATVEEPEWPTLRMMIGTLYLLWKE